MAAARAGDVTALTALLPNAPDASVRDIESGATPVHYFVASAMAVEVEEVTRQGLHALMAMPHADVNAVSGNGSTPLHWATGAGNEAAVRYLLEQGADPHARTYTWRRQVTGRGSGRTPLHWACESGHARIVQLLCDHMTMPLAHVDEKMESAMDVARRSEAEKGGASYALSLRTLNREMDATMTGVLFTLADERMQLQRLQRRAVESPR